jgi:hypothetical protein
MTWTAVNGVEFPPARWMLSNSRPETDGLASTG